MLVYGTYIITEVYKATVLTVVGRSVIIDGLTYCVLLLSVGNWKATQMNVQHNLIQKFKLYEFELSHNVVESTKNICCIKIESTVNHITITRWFKKFCFSYKNLDNPARSVDSEAVLWATVENLANSTQRVSGKLSISWSNVVCHLHNFSKRRSEPLNSVSHY